MYLKLLVRIVQVLIKVLILVSHVVALKGSDIIYPPYHMVPVKKPKIDIFRMKSDVNVLFSN